MIRAGLFLYDHLARRRRLPGSAAIDLRRHVAGVPLDPRFTHGFVYSDAWVEDSRLVVLNAIDAVDRGAEVSTRTAFVEARRDADGWRATLRSEGGADFEVCARALVNAAGPWVGGVLDAVLHRESRRQVRLVKGSHIIVRRLFDHEFAYIFQNPDRRIIFAIPYERDFTLIGTTDLEYHGDPARVAIGDDETTYLCEMAGRYFRRPVAPRDVVGSYSGVRPLLDDESTDPSSVTRDYSLELETSGAPLLSVFGGKITTYRRLAEEAVDRLAAALGDSARPLDPWRAAAGWRHARRGFRAFREVPRARPSVASRAAAAPLRACVRHADRAAARPGDRDVGSRRGARAGAARSRSPVPAPPRIRAHGPGYSLATIQTGAARATRDGRGTRRLDRRASRLTPRPTRPPEEPMPRFVLALDQGTTSCRSILFDHGGDIVAIAKREFTQHFPQPGWVEHDAQEIWAAQSATMSRSSRARGTSAAEVAAVGITNQRETTVLWDRRSGEPLGRAIVWQDRRTADRCAELRARGLEPEVARRTGLLLDPYFSGTKLAWMLENVAGARARAERGELAFGTIDSWLAWKLSGGREHVTDPTNASRTLLYDLQSGDWSEPMLEMLGIPRACLPRIVPSSAPRPRDQRRWTCPGAVGHRRRPAGRAVRPGLFHARHGQEHLWHGLLHADEHRHGAARVPQPAADDRRLASQRRAAALRARGQRLRRRRGGAVAARRARPDREFRRRGGAGGHRARQRRRLPRAGVHRPRQPALGSARARHDRRA